jgi:hypothetical protein
MDDFTTNLDYNSVQIIHLTNFLRDNFIHEFNVELFNILRLNSLLWNIELEIKSILGE